MFANGDFNKILAENTNTEGCKYQLTCNAEGFVDRAKKLGLQVVNRPCLGGIMVWYGNGALAGHVAIPVKFNNANSVSTNEQDYGNPKQLCRTWSNANGNWGLNPNSFKWLGCVVNPAIGDVCNLDVEKDETKDQIKVNITNLNVREEPSIESARIGYCADGYHYYTDKKDADGYTWYQIDSNMWVAKISEEAIEEISKHSYTKPKPVKENKNKDQVLVEISNLNIRQNASYTAPIMGFCEQGYFNVEKVENNFCKIGDLSNIALIDKNGEKIDGVTYMPTEKPKNIETRVTELEAKVTKLENLLK